MFIGATISVALPLSARTQSGSSSPIAPQVAAHKATRALVSHHLSARLMFANIAPDPSFSAPCTQAPHSTSCVASEVSTINDARVTERLAQIHLSAARFAALSPAEQVFVVTNLERIARGLDPVTAMTAQLNAAALTGARNSNDPSLAGWTLKGNKNVTEWAGNWAGGLNVLEADYYWMYDDGVGINVDCPSARSAGCWGHRDNVLIPSPTSSTCHGSPADLVMGAAVNQTSFHGSVGVAELLVASCGGLPTDTTVTWHALQHQIGL